MIILDAMGSFENMISETEMLNRISSHNRMTETAHMAFLRDSERDRNHASRRRGILVWGWLVSKA
jgi:hypothetical protein